jgi:energy-coupling factor transport system substrate-specific component
MKSLLLSATKKGTELPVGGTQLKVKDIALIGMMSSIMIAAQVCLNFLPNIELVSLLIILYTLIFGWKSLYMIYIFVAVEGLLYGFSLWWFSYLYIWLVLYLITKLFHKVTSPLYWAIISGIYGLSFGALYSIVVVLTSGINGGLASWVQGIPFDIAHAIGNFAVTLILFKPLYFILSKLNRQSEY